MRDKSSFTFLHILTKTILSTPLNFFSTFVENLLLWKYGSVSGLLYCVLLIYLSILLSITFHFNYHSFIKSLEIRQIKSSNLIHFFSSKIVLLCQLGPLLFHIYFRISLSIFTKIPLGILIGFALSLQITLGRTDMLTILSISIHEYMYLYLGLLFKSLSNTVFFPKYCKTFFLAISHASFFLSLNSAFLWPKVTSW